MLKLFKESIEVIWKNEDYDLPVFITGFIKHSDGEFYFSIENSNTFIPFNQINFGDDDNIFKLIKTLKRS